MTKHLNFLAPCMLKQKVLKKKPKKGILAKSSETHSWGWLVKSEVQELEKTCLVRAWKSKDLNTSISSRWP